MTRQRLLENCPRSYYFRSYLSHNGWLDDAPQRSRLAYRLGKLASLDTVSYTHLTLPTIYSV